MTFQLAHLVVVPKLNFLCRKRVVASLDRTGVPEILAMLSADIVRHKAPLSGIVPHPLTAEVTLCLSMIWHDDIHLLEAHEKSIPIHSLKGI